LCTSFKQDLRKTKRHSLGNKSLGLLLNEEDCQKTHSKRATNLIVASQLSSDPNKWLLKVVVIFRRNLEVLEILFSMESDLFRFHFSILHLYLVSAEHDRNIFANSRQISVIKSLLIQERMPRQISFLVAFIKT
jgi:hypothetical protein